MQTLLSANQIARTMLGPVQTSNFTCAEPNTCLGRSKLLSSTVDSDGRTLHVPNLIIRFGTCKVRRLNRALVIL